MCAICDLHQFQFQKTFFRPKKLLDVISTFRKVAGYKINLQKISSLSIYQQ
jgi:hypothetical protein